MADGEANAYQATRHPTPHGEAESCWVVEGPGLSQMAGTLPRLSQKMTREEATALADMLGMARRLGQRDAQRAMRESLGIRTFGRTVSVD